MGTHNIIVQQVKEAMWLNHKTFHNTPLTFPDEMCRFCQEEVEMARQDHLRDEIQDQEQREEVEE